MEKLTERQKQFDLAGSRGSTFTYECIDGKKFTAIALTESGAWRVLQAERPHMLAELVESKKVDAGVEKGAM